MSEFLKERGWIVIAFAGAMLTEYTWRGWLFVALALWGAFSERNRPHVHCDCPDQREL